MKSMTGYGHLSNARADLAGAAPAAELDIALRAVNGRYLELRFHLPREYSGFENEMKAFVTQTFSRGTLDIYVNRARTIGPAQIDVKVNAELARRWIESFQSLGQALNLSGHATLEQVIRVPEVLQIEQRPDVTDAEKAEVMALLSKVVMAADQERKREGQALSVELAGLCDKLEELSVQVETFKTEANAELEKRFRDRLAKLGFEGKVDDQRLAQEIVMQIDRSDVSEEITRLREHLKAYRLLLKSPEPQGKKLDFYAQELLREVNTIGSKSHIAKLTGLVVEAKTLVERIREQVQNVE